MHNPARTPSSAGQALLRRVRLALGGVLLLAACGSNAPGGPTFDRAGNTRDPVALTLGTDEEASSAAGHAISAFTDAVEAATDGAVIIDVAYGAVSPGPAWDQRVIERARDGDFDLVVARAGAWHTLGATSLDALQLPGLIETDVQADAVASDAHARDQLLAGLDEINMVGLGLYPEEPRYLMLLDGTSDFDLGSLRGRLVRAPLSQTVFDLLHALNMTPVDLDAADFTVQVPEGSVTATEGGFDRVQLTSTTDDHPVVVGDNLVLFTKFLVLAISSDSLDRLDETLVERIRQAAVESIGVYLDGRRREADRLVDICAAGATLVDIPDADREALRDAMTPVVAAVEAGPGGTAIAAVRAAAGPAAPTDWSCPDDGPATGSVTDPDELEVATADGSGYELLVPAKRSDIVPDPGNLPDGVYRFTQTQEALDATGAPPDDRPFIGEFWLQGGHAELRYFELDGSPEAGEPPDTGGLYAVVGDDLLIFATPPERAIPGTTGIYLLRWQLDGDTLTLTQIDEGRPDADFYVPWIRVGDVPG